MEYRLAKRSDIDAVYTLIKAAIVQMEADGIYQWDDIYPTKEDFINDMEKESLYLAIDRKN